MNTMLRNRFFRFCAAVGFCMLMAGGCALPQKITLSFSENRQPLTEDREGLVVTKKTSVPVPSKQTEKEVCDLSRLSPETDPRLTQSPAIGFQMGNEPVFSLLTQPAENNWLKLLMSPGRFTLLNEAMFAGSREKSASGSSSENPDGIQRLVVYEAFFEVEKERGDPQEMNLDIIPEPDGDSSDLVLRAGDFVFRAKVKNLKVTFTWPLLEGIQQVNTHLRVEPSAVMWWLNLKW